MGSPLVPDVVHALCCIFRIRRYECRSCSSRFSDFSGTYLARTKLSPSEILLGVRLFELGLSAREASKQVEVNYKSMLRLYNTIRQAIVDYSHQTNRAPLSGEVEMDETYFGGKRKGKRGRGANNKIPVFGMMERNGKVMVEPVPNVSAETLTRNVKDLEFRFNNRDCSILNKIIDVITNLLRLSGQSPRNMVPKGGLEPPREQSLTRS